MLRSRVLRVLDRIARREDGDSRAARVEAYADTDPLVRGLVRSRVERAVAEAIFETARGDDERHVHRLASLRLSGALDVSADDVDAVERAFEARGVTARPSRHGATLTIATALVTSALLAGGLVAWISRDPASVHSELPTSRGAWVHGGRPEPGSDAVRAVFERAIPAWVVRLDAARRAREGGDAAEALAALDAATRETMSASERALGADTSSFLRAVLDQSRTIVESDGATGADSHVRSVDALVAAVASRGLGYYVDAEVLTDVQTGRHRVYLSTFTVERVSFYDGGTGPVRALRLRRLDRLNFARSVLGFTRPQVQDGLVLLGRVEDYLVDVLLPALGPDAPMPLADPESTADAAWVEEVERAAGADARDEASRSLGDRAATLGAVLARRRALLDGWEARFSRSGIRVGRPRTYDFDVAGYAALEARVPRSEWRELESIAEDLSDDVTRGAYRDYEELFVASVERHEVQHRLDYADGEPTEMPEALEALTGPLEARGMENRRAKSALAELSAYLSELARGPEVVKTNLALFSRHLFLRPRWGTGECYAALVVFEGLGDTLGIPHGPLLASRQIDREAFAALYLALRARSAEELSRAAGQLWGELFGRPLATLRRIE